MRLLVALDGASHWVAEPLEDADTAGDWGGAALLERADTTGDGGGTALLEGAHTAGDGGSAGLLQGADTASNWRSTAHFVGCWCFSWEAEVWCEGLAEMCL